MAQNPTLKGKQALLIYKGAFPDLTHLDIRYKATKSGHIVTAILGEEVVDRVLVRYDGIIFRDFKQVHPEVSNG